MNNIFLNKHSALAALLRNTPTVSSDDLVDEAIAEELGIKNEGGMFMIKTDEELSEEFGSADAFWDAVIARDIFNFDA